ncbi:pilin [Patescibacteria group bacterium]|nr:pilin [Patescibacteria group bacterium]MBU4347778.1 pilin [Patescibacteria group bacterium]MBU4455325.1 pilin [Patescibacteria group bacterium]MCG2690958.1 pilin [Candidatus Parcubacteria bacterium]
MLVKEKKILIIIILFLLAFFALTQSIVLAADSDKYGLEATAGAAQLSTKDKDISLTIGKVVGAGLAFIGVIFFLLIIYGGLLWMTARGNEQQVTKAKDLIISAVIGLVIVLSAYAITKYVGGIFGQTSSG